MKFIKGARTWRSILGTQTFFWPLTHPPTPPPRYSINQPLSKGLPPSPESNTEVPKLDGNTTCRCSDGGGGVYKGQNRAWLQKLRRQNSRLRSCTLGTRGLA